MSKVDKVGKKNKAGGSLIELLIFISLLIVIFKLTNVWVISVYRPAIEKSRILNRIVALQAGITFLLRDLLSAPSALEKWKKKDATELIWSTTKTDAEKYVDIGWSYNAGKLIRTEGYFDLKTGRWKNKHISLISRALTSFSFALFTTDAIIKDIIIAVEIEAIINSHVIKRKICLRNRILNNY